MRRLLLSFIITLLASPLAAREWYVNNALGNDALSGRLATLKGKDGPLKRIRVALCLATPGDQIYVAKTDEPYREELSIAGRCLRGLRDMPLVIDGGGATLDGTVIAEQGAWRHAAGDVFALRPRRLTYQQLFVAGKPLTRVLLASTMGIEQELKPLQWARRGADFGSHRSEPAARFVRPPPRWPANRHHAVQHASCAGAELHHPRLSARWN